MVVGREWCKLVYNYHSFLYEKDSNFIMFVFVFCVFLF